MEAGRSPDWCDHSACAKIGAMSDEIDAEDLDSDEPIHVVPVDDLIEHITDGEDCPCGPVTEPVEREDGSMGWLVVHNALDGREHDEEDHDRANCPVCSKEDAA